MPRTKKGPGRGRTGRPLPPKIDATMEKMAKAMFAMPADHEWQYEKGEGKVYQCEACERVVSFPETLYQDGKCEDCHNAQATTGRGHRCTCGIEVAKASMCTEADCPYRR